MARTDRRASGAAGIWLCAAASALALLMLLGLLALLALRGLGQFWPAALQRVEYALPAQQAKVFIGQWQYARPAAGESAAKRRLLKVGARERGADFIWLEAAGIAREEQPETLWLLERREWGDCYGELLALLENGAILAEGEQASALLAARVARSNALWQRIWQLRQNPQQEGTHEQRALALLALERALQQDSLLLQGADGQPVQLGLAQVTRAYQPNRMPFGQKIALYGEKLWAFLSEAPRAAGSEGGIFPALFGTLVLTLLMSVLVTPLGLLAALYLHEYARAGWLTRLIRLSVHNLAAVPSIVYGVFGLGFFVYVLGGSIDRLFFSQALPAPTFGTPGLFWAALTLALLTLPVVIVSCEEGLARIPRSLREACFALGATRAQTLLRLLLPMASPALLSGVILAVARAAGEVAPLMLVGVVKSAPMLAVSAEPPFVHLERKIMHLGFHLYDLALHSPHIEAARPLVYASALLLVLLIVLLNLSAMLLRSRLREKYRLLET